MIINIIMRIDCYLMMSLYLGTLEKTLDRLEKATEERRRCKDVHTKLEAQSNSTSSPPRIPGLACTKIDAQDASGVHF